jgi:hypothetical protein
LHAASIVIASDSEAIQNIDQKVWIASAYAQGASADSKRAIARKASDGGVVADAPRNDG